MSATGPSSPQPTSAAVLEFICLFTHDLRRKQKRWQDGRLKYHTFNNRVMVYDDRGNFVGDMHWRHDWDLVEGEELQLERGGVIVQVQELSSRCEQDLSELLEKRAKEKEQRQIQAASRSPATSALPRTAVRPIVHRPIPPDHAQLRHRPLHQVIGTPSGHHGRASVPKESPFEQRHQGAESPDERAAKRRKYDAPPPSKSGYASALFGQALTLSATPMSSVPVAKRQPMRKRDSSPEDEGTTRLFQREEPKPALRDQPKASRHFNQSHERARPTDTAKLTLPSHHDVENKDEPTAKRKYERSLPTKHQTPKRRNPDSEDDEMIEIDDPATTPMEEPVRQTAAETEAVEVRKKTKARATISSSRQISDLPRTKAGRSDVVTEEETGARARASKTQKGSENSKKTKTKMPKPDAKKSSGETPAATFSPRKPCKPITELRIKPRKKRGLMMMSDLPKKSAEQLRGGSTASLAVAETAKVKEVEKTDYSSRSLSPRLHEGMQSKEPSQKGESIFRGTKSAELEGVQETVRSPSPKAHVERSGRSGKAPSRTGYSTQLEEDDDPPRSPTPPLCAPKGTKGSKRSGKIVAARRISKELGEDDDPLRESSPLPTASPGLTAHQGVEDLIDDMDSVGPGQEDDFGAAPQMDIDDITATPLGEIMGIVSTSPSQGMVYDPYRLPMSSPKEMSKPPSRIASLPNPRTCPNTSDDVAPKKRSKLKQVTKAAKRMPKARDQESDPEAEDEQPVKRRMTTRKLRSRIAEPEEDSLPSEQEDSEDEARFKISRKGEAPKASEDRPRLEKIKKSVKSRELVGFNLAALNAPVGLRKIGVPFSILSSPADESILKRMDNHAAQGPSSDSLLASVDERIPTATLDVLQMVTEADEIVVDKFSPGAGRSTQPPEPTTQLGEPTVSTGGVDSFRAEDSGNLFKTASPAFSSQTKDTNTIKDSTSSPDTSQPKKRPASSLALEHKPGHGANTMEVTAESATSEIQQPSECRSLPLVDASTAHKPAEDTSRSVQRQVLAEPRAADIVLEQLEQFADGETASVHKVSVAKPFIPPSTKSTAAIQGQDPSNVTAIMNEDTPQESEAGDVCEARPTAVPTLPAFKRPEQEATPSLPRQLSHTAAFNAEARSSHRDEEAIDSKTAAEVLEPVEEGANKPPPALRRQTSTFRPPTKAKVMTPQIGNGSTHQLNQTVTNAPNTEPNMVQPAKLTRALSRSNSAFVPVSETNETADCSNATESTRAVQELALPVQRQSRVGLHRAVSITRRINNLTAELPRSVPVDGLAPPAESSTKHAPNAHIMNPASRGRKAAVKSDAKGPVPQRMLPPTQPFAMPPLSTADFASTPIGEPQSEPERPKKKMTFPGFQSARDEGPWSREAFDLLESGRPV